MSLIPDGTGVYYDSSDYINLVSTADNLVNFVGKKSCKTISESSFQSCIKKLQTITFEAESQLESIANSVWDGSTSLISADFTNCGKLKSLPERLLSYSNIQTINLPPNLYSIGSHCFYNSKKLQDFSLPDSCEVLSYWFIYNCTQLKHIEISSTSNLKTIGAESFVYCCLESFYITKNITSFDGVY